MPTYFEQIPFEGTDEERQANFDTHYFYADDPNDGSRCMNCDCRPWGMWANYPCGIAEIPTRSVHLTEDAAAAQTAAADAAWTAKMRLHMEIDAMVATWTEDYAE